MKPTNPLRNTGLFVVLSACVALADQRIDLLNARIAENQTVKAFSGHESFQEPEEKVTVDLPKDSLLERVSFLTDGSLTVIVPQGAVVEIPGNHRLVEGNRIVGKLIEWPEFLSANRGILKLIDIRGDKLRNPDPIDPTVLDEIRKNHLVGITTYQGRPVALKHAPEPAQP